MRGVGGRERHTVDIGSSEKSTFETSASHVIAAFTLIYALRSENRWFIIPIYG